MKPHVCMESTTCLCDITALEPNPKCPVHGHPWPPRCCICGRMLRRELK